VPLARAKPNSVVRVCRAQDAEISFIKSEMHMIVAQKVEDRDFRGPSGRPIFQGMG